MATPKQTSYSPSPRSQLCRELAKSEYRSLQTDRERAVHLREGGYSLGAISKALSVPKSTVKRWCHNPSLRDCPGRPKLLSDSQSEKLLSEVMVAAQARKPMKTTHLRRRVGGASHWVALMAGILHLNHAYHAYCAFTCLRRWR
jgi:hypothetical protein